MKKTTLRWLLCLALVLVMAMSLTLAACNPEEEEPEVKKYTLSFKLGDHAAATATAPASVQLEKGAKHTLPNAPAAADNWEFDGWGSDKLAAGAEFTMPEKDVELTAQWKAVQQQQPDDPDPFADAPFDGAIVDLQIGSIIFTSTEADGKDGHFGMQLFSSAGSMDALYTLDDGEIAIYNGEMEKIGEGAIDGNKLTLTIDLGADDPLEVEVNMYKLVISGIFNDPLDFYFNEGGIIIALADLADGDVESAKLNGEDLDVAAELAAMQAGNADACTKMPAKDSTLELTLAVELPEPTVADIEAWEGTWHRQDGSNISSFKYISIVKGQLNYSNNATYFDSYYENIVLSRENGKIVGVCTFDDGWGDKTVFKLIFESEGKIQLSLDNGPLMELVIVRFFEVSFDLGEYTEGTAPATKTVVENEKTTAPSVTWEGHRLVGWFAEGATEAFDFANTPITANITLTAHWEESSETTLTYEDFYGIWSWESGDTFYYNYIIFDANNGKFDFSSSWSGMSGYYTVTTTVEDGVLKGTYSSWTFIFEAEDRIQVIHSSYGTAYFVRLATVTVTFALGDEYAGTSSAPASKIVAKGTTITAPTATITWEGHRFLGWFAEGAEEAFDFANTPITGDITLTAHWEVAEYWIITFVANAGDSQVDNMPEPIHVTLGETGSAPTEIPTREGYKFKFWSVSTSYGSEYDFSAVLENDLTLYASWERVYTVTFSVDGSTDILPSVQTGYYTQIDLPELAQEHWKDGYVFLGWATSTSYSSYSLAGGKSYIYYDITYYAVFGKVYTDSNGGNKELIVHENGRVEGSLIGDTYNRKGSTQAGTLKENVISWTGTKVNWAVELDENDQKFTELDAMYMYSYTSKDDKKLSFDGKGKATLDDIEYTYTVTLAESGEIEKFTLTINDEQKDFALIYNSSSYYVLHAVIKVSDDKEYIFGNPMITVTIVYEKQTDETGSVPESKTVQVAYKGEADLDLDDAVNILLKEGKIFIGWKLKDGEGEGSLIHHVEGLDANITLTFVAVWYDAKTLTAKFEADDKTAGEVPADISILVKVDGDGTIVLPLGSGLRKDDLVVVGWKEKDVENATQYEPGASVVIDKDTTFVAVWGERVPLFDEFMGESLSSAVAYGGTSADFDDKLESGNYSFWKVELYWSENIYTGAVSPCLKYYSRTSSDYWYIWVDEVKIEKGAIVAEAKVPFSTSYSETAYTLTIVLAYNDQDQRTITITGPEGNSVTWIAIDDLDLAD